MMNKYPTFRNWFLVIVASSLQTFLCMCEGMLMGVMLMAVVNKSQPKFVHSDDWLLQSPLLAFVWSFNFT